MIRDKKQLMKECVDEAIEVLREHMPIGTKGFTVEECTLAIKLYMERKSK